MTITQAKAAIFKIAGELSALPESERAKAYEEKLEELPSDVRELAAAFLTVSVVMGNPMNSSSKSSSSLPTWEKVCLYSGAAVMLGGMVIYSLFVVNPTPQQEFVFRLVCGLGAATLGAFLPGFLHIEGKLANFSLRAGGALGMFVLVYAVNPPALSQKKGEVPPPATERAEAKKATPAPVNP